MKRLGIFLVVALCIGIIIKPDAFLGVLNVKKSPQVQEICVTRSIPYQTTENEDASMEIGKSKTLQEGVEGKKKICSIGEDSREEILNQPVNQVNSVGTAQPAPKPLIQYHEPSGAICADGWRSYSTGSGTCSHHGGIDYYL